MIFERLIIRYGEASLKGKNKRKFTVRLEELVREKLRSYPNLKIRHHFDHIEIVLNGEEAKEIAEKLRHVFGIHAIWPVVSVPNESDRMKEAALLIAQHTKDLTTFKVSARRKNKRFPIDSNQLNTILGGHILTNTNNLTVDVHKPDLNIRVDVKENETWLYGKKWEGLGGLPVGTAGKIMLMLSGGIDSPVAGYLLQKRGATIEALHFQSPPYTSDRAKQKVYDLVEKLEKYGDHLTLHLVPFTEIQIAIRDNMPDNYRMTITRRMMLRIAEKIALQNNALAIATGESLGQVASQTLESMNTINEVTTLPVMRPLLTMDKLEIMKIAEEIDTYSISIRPYEDCCTLFLPSAPKTKPTREGANKFEYFLPIEELIEEAVARTEKIDFTNRKDLEAFDEFL